MKLTEKEKEICKRYTSLKKCPACPLAIDKYLCRCYATIDGRTREAKRLKRYGKEVQDA